MESEQLGKERVTMQDVADAAGVSRATVCRALKNSPYVKKTTCSRVREAAKRLGYRTDPAFRILSAQRWKAIKADSALTLAMLKAGAPDYKDVGVVGAMDRCKELGVQMELFGVDAQNASARLRMLRNRGVNGLLLHTESWKLFESIKASDSFSLIVVKPMSFSLRFHQIRDNPFSRAILILSELSRRGYKRIGMAQWFEPDSEVDMRVFGALHAYWSTSKTPRKNRIPPLNVSGEWFYRETSDGLEAPDVAPTYMRWLEKWKPDVVVGCTEPLYWILKNRGYRMPEDIGFMPMYSFEFRDLKEVGRRSVDQLLLLLRSNERGGSNTPFTLTVNPQLLPYPHLRLRKPTLRANQESAFARNWRSLEDVELQI